ncbi:MAG: NAD-dependent epimerase/dehydratase family protein [Myxococcales bacterium]|nr:NAD-dependent epimerase/dehydratase family protein [Myxococcales bacterium]
MHATWSETLSLSGARVLVTGGHGFLGKHVTAALVEAGAVAIPVGRADAQLGDPGQVARLFADHAPDLVVHAAAVGGGIGWMKEHPATALSGNLLANTNVLDAAFRAGVRRLLGVSSACAYARDAAQPMSEDRIYEGEPEPTNGPYGHAKRMLMRHGAALGQEFGFDTVFVVPTNLYGPGESFDPARSHVVGGLVRRFEVARRAGDASVACWGSGQATRDLLYVTDAAALILRALQAGGGPEPVNLGSGVERTIAEIALATAGACGFRGSIAWDTSKPDGMPRKQLDDRLARSRLGPYALTGLNEGLAETVACFRSS